MRMFKKNIFKQVNIKFDKSVKKFAVYFKKIIY